MDLNKVTVKDIYDLIYSCDLNTNLTHIEEELNIKNVYEDNLCIFHKKKFNYDGILTVDFIIPIKFSLKDTPISIRFVITQTKEEEEIILNVKDPVLISYDLAYGFEDHLVVSEINLLTLDYENKIFEYTIAPLKLSLDDTVVNVYQKYKVLVSEYMELKQFVENKFNNTNWDEYYNIANFLPIEKWKCSFLIKRFEDYLNFLKESNLNYFKEMLLVDNIFTNFKKFIVTKDLPKKYDFDKYKTLKEQVEFLLQNKELLTEITELSKLKRNIEIAQLEYDNEKNNLFHKIRNKYNIPLEELLLK